MATHSSGRVGPTRPGVLLLLDTCAEQASLALFRLGPRAGDPSELLGERLLAERTASSTLLGGLRALLAEHEVLSGELTAIGVVDGPGSFTGVRVGLAFAKGLCEANAVALATVSRLHVLALAAGLTAGFAVLPAGRGQLYLRQIPAGDPPLERLADLSDSAALLAGHQVAVASSELADALRNMGCHVTQVALSAASAFPAVLACLETGGTNPSTADANYVREEASIYRKESR